MSLINNKSNTVKLVSAMIFLLLASIFVFDLMTPLGIAVGMSYSVPLLLTIWTGDKTSTKLVTLVSCILILIGYYLSPIIGDVRSIAIVNRSLSEICIAFISIIILKYKDIEWFVKSQQLELESLSTRLKEINSNLETEVEERTKVLSEALEELEHSKNELSIALEQEKELTAIKTRIVSMASHEFRTPLATILTSVELISKYNETGQKEKQSKHFKKIRSSIMHLTELLEDTLSVSKLEEGKISFLSEKIAIGHFIQELINEMQSITKVKINYTHHGNSEIINDKKILRRIISNLISNAVKFSHEHSEVDVISKIENDKILLCVTDYGIGIPEKDQIRLFERFFRSENAFNIQGTGLGLCIINKYIQLLGGEINVKSKENIGSTFTIKLPIISELKPYQALIPKIKNKVI